MASSLPLVSLLHLACLQNDWFWPTAYNVDTTTSEGYDQSFCPGHCCVSNTWNVKQWSTTYTLMLYSTHEDSKTGHGLVCYCFTNMKRHLCWFVWPGVWRLHTDVLLCWFSPLRHSHHTILLFCPKAVKMLFCTTKLLLFNIVVSSKLPVNRQKSAVTFDQRCRHGEPRNL